jgi:rsbT co-antagonist protein RsbR
VTCWNCHHAAIVNADTLPDAVSVLAWPLVFRNPHVLAEAKRVKHEHLLAMVSSEYGKSYVEQRVKLGSLYSSAGLDVRLFLGAFHRLMQSIGDTIAADRFPSDSQSAFQHFTSINKIASMDIGIIVDVLIAER